MGLGTVGVTLPDVSVLTGDGTGGLGVRLRPISTSITKSALTTPNASDGGCTNRWRNRVNQAAQRAPGDRTGR